MRLIRVLTDLFENQVKNHPEKAAIKYETDLLTYNQLNLQANKLAHYIKKQFH